MDQEKYYSNALARQIKQLPDYMEQINKNVAFIPLMECISMKEIRDIKRIILTGCGDSYLAGIAMKPVMEEITGLDVEVCRSIDFSRFYREDRLGRRPNDPLVVLISISGNISRILEAARRARIHGANTLAITDSLQTSLAKECAHVLALNTPPTERAPGCGSYIASCFALLGLSIRIGRVNAAFIPPEEDLYRAIAMDYIRSYTPEVFDRIAGEMYELAQTWKNAKSIDFVGDGGSFASAQFSAWKCVESYGGLTSCDDSENWLHENYLLAEPERIPAVVFAPSKSPSLGRISETVEEMCRIGRNVLIVTDDKENHFTSDAKVCRIPTCEDYRYAPLMEHVPALFLASYLGEMLGRHYFREGDGDNWTQPTGIYPIRRSKIVVL